jgi:hypothetical protein
MPEQREPLRTEFVECVQCGRRYQCDDPRIVSGHTCECGQQIIAAFVSGSNEERAA